MSKPRDGSQEIKVAAKDSPGFLKGALSWVDNSVVPLSEERPGRRVHWTRIAPFVFLHGGCLAVLWTGWSPVAAAVAAVLFAARTFFLTGFYHRYFSHKTFETSRAAQFIFAVLGNTAVQRDALWWGATHRHHHAASDTPEDPHSPTQHGIFWSHIGWLFDTANYNTRWKLIPDLARFPELRWLNRFDVVVVAALFASLYGLGAALASWAPGLGTSGWQMVVWGFFISTVLLFHTTQWVNSASHLVRRKRFANTDTSRNSLVIALLTMGEGWHNNHHYYPASVRQGFYWWQIDMTYYVLWMMERLGIIWNLNAVPERILAVGRENPGRQESRRRANAA